MTQAELDHNGDNGADGDVAVMEQTEHQMVNAPAYHHQQQHPTPQMANGRPYHDYQQHCVPPGQAYAPAWQNQQHCVSQQVPHAQQWPQTYPQPETLNGQPNYCPSLPPLPPTNTQHYYQPDGGAEIERERAVRQGLCEKCISHRNHRRAFQRTHLEDALLRDATCELCHKCYPLVDFVHRRDPADAIYKPTAMCLGHSRWIRLCPHRAVGVEDVREALRQKKDNRPTDQETVLADCKQCFQGRRPPQRPALTTVRVRGRHEYEVRRRYDLTFNIPLDWIGNGEDKNKDKDLELEYRALLCGHYCWSMFKAWVADGRSRGETKGRRVCNSPGCNRKYGWSLSAKGKPIVTGRNSILTSSRADLADAGLQPCKVERLPTDLEALDQWRNIFWCDDSDGKCYNALLPGKRLDLQVREAIRMWPTECPHPGGWLEHAKERSQHAYPYNGGPSGYLPDPPADPPAAPGNTPTGKA